MYFAKLTQFADEVKDERDRVGKFNDFFKVFGIGYSVAFTLSSVEHIIKKILSSFAILSIRKKLRCLPL